MKTWLLLLAIIATNVGNILADEVDYLRDVKPILMEKCSSCHGALKQESDLRLDSGLLIQKGGASGAVIEPGRASASRIFQRVIDADPDQRMPPADGFGEPLNTEQIKLLKNWIDQGAPIPEEEPPPADPRNHWAYQAPRKQAPPGSDSENPIDRFLQMRRQPMGIRPIEQADRPTRLRRLYFDLIGLPPSADQLNSFADDDSPEAWNKLVDDLLAQPQYGERWGRHWMDVWRYSDWDGYQQELRGSQRHIWHWRDWIVKSLNDDKPYAQMIVEMLAADESAPKAPEALAATGFLARNFHKGNRDIWLDATVEHTAKAFLGMTLNCARCHDHKYDPISQKSFYEFRAIFEPHQVRTDRLPGQANIQIDGLPRAFDQDLSAQTFIYAGGDEKNPLKDIEVRPNVPSILGGQYQVQPVSLPIESWFPAFRQFVLAEERSKLKTTRIQTERKLKESAPHRIEPIHSIEYSILALEYAVASLKLHSFDSRCAAEKARLYQLKAADVTARQAAKDERKLQIKTAELALARKQLELTQAQTAEPNDVPSQQKLIDKLSKEFAALETKLNSTRTEFEKDDNQFTPLGDTYPKTSSGRRLALARWIASKHNPLTARVAVNQIWMRHFGAPLVENVFDFGLRSPVPRHAELLDWLAVEFMEHDWSMKHLHRLILTSKTWQLASTSGSEVAEKNRELDPENAFYWRADVRRLDAEIIRDNVLAVAGQLDLKLGGPDVDFKQGETSRRRSIYLRHAYEKQMRMLVLFDTANPNECYRRSESIIPQQALALVNSGLCQEQSRLLARQIWASVTGSDSQKVQGFLVSAFVRILGRDASKEEINNCLEFLDRQAVLLSNPERLTEFTHGQPAAVAPSEDPQGRARENLIHVLMNHNDFVTVR